MLPILRQAAENAHVTLSALNHDIDLLAVLKNLGRLR